MARSQAKPKQDIKLEIGPEMGGAKLSVFPMVGSELGKIIRITVSM